MSGSQDAPAHMLLHASWEAFADKFPKHVQYEASASTLLFRVKSLAFQQELVEQLQLAPLPRTLAELSIVGGLRGPDHSPSQLVDAVLHAVCTRNAACASDRSLSSCVAARHRSASSLSHTDHPCPSATGLKCCAFNAANCHLPEPLLLGRPWGLPLLHPHWL